jgi:hypothetical protein
MTRSEILARDRHLRRIGKEQLQAVLDVIAPNVALDWAKRLGLARGRTVLVESEQEMTLAEDLAIYLARPGRSHPLDRYARAARLAPGSDEAIVLEAMRRARFSLWRVERRHGTMGLVLRDLLRGGDIWLVDEALERSARPAGTGDGRASAAARRLRDDRPHRRTGHSGSDGGGFRQGSCLEARPGGCPRPGPALRDRHLPSRRGHGSDGLRPLQARIGPAPCP